MKNKIRTTSAILAIITIFIFTSCQTQQETTEGIITPQENLSVSQSGTGGE